MPNREDQIRQNFANQVAGNQPSNNPLSSYGIDDQTYQELAPFMSEVATPQYGFGDFITGKWAQKQQAYIQELKDRKTNAEALASARAYENTAIQRQVADMKKAGLNPYWLTSASASATGSSSSSDSRNTYKAHGSSSGSNDMAKNLMNILKTVAVLAFLYG